MERTTVLSPLAAAVSLIGTDCMISTGIAAKLTAMPIETIATPSMSWTREASSSTRTTYPRPVMPRPAIRVMRAPKRRVIDADTGAIRTIRTPPGNIASPASVTPSPNPTPVSTGICSCWVATSRLVNIAKPASSDAMLVSSTGRRVEVRRSTSGSPVRSSQGAHIAKTRTATTNDSTVHCEVQPQTPPLEMPSSRAVSAMDSSIGAQPVEAAGCPHPGLRHHRQDEHEHHDGHDDAAPEHGLPAEGLVDHARQGKPHGAADAERGAHQRDGATDPLRRQLVAHRRDADRDEGRREALQHPGDDQQRQRVAQRTEQGPEQQGDQRDDDHPALAVHVGEAGQDRGRDGAGEQRDRHQPRGVVRASCRAAAGSRAATARPASA